jgi:hypothetical protein
MTALSSTASAPVVTHGNCGGVAPAPAEARRVGIGRLLIGLGAVLLVVGLIVEFLPGLRLGRLPGDFAFGSGNVRVYIPLGTSIVLSLLLTLVFGLLSRR